MRPSQHVASLLVFSLLCFDSVSAQQSSSKKPAPKNATSEQLASLTKQAEKYEALLQDPDVNSSPELTAAVKEKWIDVTCRAKQLNLSLVGIQDAALSKQLYDSCALRLRNSPEVKGNTQPTATTTPSVTRTNQTSPPFPPGVQPPQSCRTFPPIPFDQSVPADNTPISMGSSKINLDKLVRLNATGSGGEIYTKAGVYVAYVNRLRYTASLGGTVSAISAPTIPFNQILTTSPLGQAQNPNTKPTVTKKPGAEKTPQEYFNDFSDCYQSIWETLTMFQGKLATEELQLNDTKLKISAATTNLQPVVKTANEVRSSADLTVFPPHESPAFPVADLEKLKILNQEFMVQYAKVHDWVTASGSDYNVAEYARVTAGAKDISNRLDQYLATASSTTNTAAGTAGDGAAPKKPTPPTTPNGANPSNNPPANSSNGTNRNNSSDNASEAAQYEVARVYVSTWRQIFRTVKGANDDYFVETFQPQCGGFFGDGTSTQMQLSIVDSLNPPAAGTKVTPTNLDKVICQPTISISNGLGLSFISSQTPAFVPAVKKDSNGNPVLDSSGNPTIIQSLGYSNQSAVGAGYALQTNASLWATQRWGFEIHWSLGAMLTASSNGATTDIITGPSFSFHRRTFFVSPMYDLGLRTVYVSPFKVGMPQGNLTSPPTQQVWKSGFGLTITFPFKTGTKDVDSGSGGANVTNPATNNATPSTQNKKNP